MKEFMEKHRQEVVNMFTEEWNLEEAKRVAAEEAAEKAAAEGRIKSVKDLIKAGLVTFEKIKNSGLYTEAELSAIASV